MRNSWDIICVGKLDQKLLKKKYFGVWVCVERSRNAHQQSNKRAKLTMYEDI